MKTSDTVSPISKVLIPKVLISKAGSRLQRAVLYSLCFILYSSCDDKIDLKLNTAEPYLVVDATVDDNAGTNDTVRLSSSTGYLANGLLPPVTGASVRLTGTDGQDVTLEEARPGRYVARGFAGGIGQSYTLQIATSDLERYEAVGRINRSVPIDSVRAIFYKDRPFREDGYYAKIWYTEPAGKGDYTRIDQYYNDTLQNRVRDLISFGDDFGDGSQVQGVELNFDPLQVGDTIRVRLVAISQDADYFYQELRTQTQNGGLFSQPPANVRTNVRNLNPASKKRASGFFFTIAYSEAALRIKE